MKKSLFYHITDSNQIIVKEKGKENAKNLNGKFLMDKDNNLIYKVDKRQHWYKKYNIPDKMHFKGDWKLDPDHNLVLDLRREKRLKSKKLRIRGKIVNPKADSFIFQIKSSPEFGTSNIHYLKLKGFWRTDRFNRIIFEVKKKNSNNSLILKNSWVVNKNNQITYQYEKLITKTKQKITLEGHWDIPGKNKLCYIVSKKAIKSRLNFNVFLETPNVYPAKGKIKYRVKIGLKKKRETRVIELLGAWKFSRKLGLTYQIDYGAGEIKRIKFNAKLNIAKKNKLVFSLYDTYNRPLGISITFLKHHPQMANKNFNLFLKLKKEGKTPRIEIGGTIRF